MTLLNPVFLAFVALAILALCPLLYAMWRVGTPRGRRDSALALHRAQLAELDRERDDGRIGPAEHAAARLEIQRRLLAAADLGDEIAPRSARLPLILALILVPLAGAALYFIDGHPELPSGVRSGSVASPQDAQEADQLIAMLRARLSMLDPKTDVARQGYMLLGNAEASRGHLAEAAAAWRTALEAEFDPNLAAQAAEAQFQADGTMSPQTADLFRRALAQAPPDAPWTALVRQRLGAAP